MIKLFPRISAVVLALLLAACAAPGAQAPGSMEVRQGVIEQITPIMPRVMDAFQTYLRELRPMDLDGSAGLYRLKEELTRRVNLSIAPARINAVLFKEIVVQ